MTGIITGDVANSKSVDASLWMPELKQTLGKYGKEPAEWEIYRGDSFQLEVQPENALTAALHLKACIKQFSKLDIRAAIGIGDKTYTSGKITESNGSAFVHSGKCFEQLKKQTLAIKTPWEEFDSELNTILKLASLKINSWSSVTANIMKRAIENPEANQIQLARIMQIEQSNISRGLNRAGYEEIMELVALYKKNIKSLC
ncbi:MAG: hypothetical protein JXB24_13095 [Bacteroidales bacterium]|nr:hypothetical protein [Bacteroidales bacterium]